MSTIRKLASQTAIYGLSSIIGRFLNYLLVPLHTIYSGFTTDQYGVISEMYAYVAFLVVLLTYGMETAFFRFNSNPDLEKKRVYSTALWTLFISTGLFIVLCWIFQQAVADWLHYPNNAEYVTWFAIIVGLDAISSIPLAKLRSDNKPMIFAFINLSSVAVNIFLNLFFLLYCKSKFDAGEHNWLVDTFYNDEIGVGYVFISNLVASIAKFVMLFPWMLSALVKPSLTILEKMLLYGLPLLIAGLAGIVNETIDRIMLKRMLSPEYGETYALSEVGIYSAVYKISIIITLFIQAFRFAAEPFFFAQAAKSESKEIYAKVMNYFVIVCAVIFLGVMLFLDIAKYFIGEEYWVGLHIVPILLFANIFLGIYYNQSVWYKLTGHTMFGAYIAIFGAIITITLNLILIPLISYEGSAWTTLICYFSMAVASYILGQKYFPVPYNLFKMFFYIGTAFGFYYASTYISHETTSWYFVNTLLLSLYLGMVWLIEKPKKNPSYESENS
jgi:O-antigen/teichoic acid export membrane protein